ncbi:prepilin-type N-terminal cleavage/methylation domain-containing protein [Vibrio harveyi]
MRRSKGFTLLELVIVVVVLALVSVTSAPRILGFLVMDAWQN